MRKQLKHRRRIALSACSVAVAVGLTACAPDSADSGADAPHPGHGASSPVASEPLRAGERFLNLTMPESYTPAAPNGGTDDYRCLLIDPGVTKPMFLTGALFQPQNAKLVHHAVVQVVAPEAEKQARAKDAETPGPGWTCFGDTGLGPAAGTYASAWTPNGTESVLRQDVGFPVKPGSLIVVQAHYNLLATDGRTGETDRSSVRLRLTDGTSATRPLRTLPLQAPIELPCAEGESGALCDRATSLADVTKRFGDRVGGIAQQLLKLCGDGKPVPGDTQRCDHPVRQPMTVYAALGHMHMLGRSIKVELNPGTAQAQTLLDVPEFDFDHQKTLPLPTPVEVKPGDTLRVTCTHDAGLRRRLPALSKLPPRYVVWGDGSSDEMCTGFMITSATAGS